MNIGAYLVETLADFGVTHIFGIPGDSIDTIMEPLRRSRRLTYVQVRHEEAGAFMASAHAKLTGRLAATMGTAGPGAIHLLNGLYDAKLDRVPVIAITGQVQSDLIGTGYFQEINLARLFDDVALYNHTVETPEQAWAMIPTACREAIMGRGVAHLTFPFDVPRMDVARGHRLAPLVTAPPFRPTDDDIAAAVRLIEGADRPVALFGMGCRHAGAELGELARKLALPLVHTLPAKGVLPDEQPLLMGGLGLLGAKPAHRAVEEADLLLLLGSDYPYLRFLPEHTKVVQLDVEPRKLGSRLVPDVPLLGDARSTLPLLAAGLQPRKPSSWVKGLMHERAAWLEAVARDGQHSGKPLRPQFVARTLSEAANDDAVIAMDVGNSLVWMARGFVMRRQRFLVSGWLGSMGFGLPAAIAAALAEPDRQAIAVVGDGGFAMLMADLVTAVKYELPVKVIVLNNHKLAMIKFEQEVAGYPEWGVDLTNPDFALYARAAGAQGYRVEDPGDLEDAVREAFSDKGPSLVDVTTDPDVPPIPPRISLGEARNYAVALFRETFSV